MNTTTDSSTPAALKSIPAGEYFKRTETAQQVYIKGPYDRSMKAYECSKASDINSGSYIKGKAIVFVGFTY